MEFVDQYADVSGSDDEKQEVCEINLSEDDDFIDDCAKIKNHQDFFKCCWRGCFFSIW